MTCIAFCPKQGGRIGADTLVSVGATKHYGSKLVRLPDGSIFGASGDASACAGVIAWLQGERKGKCSLWSKINALHLAADALHLYAKTHHPIELDRAHPAAVGSGMDAALGALRAGCTLEQAVKAAIDTDTGCGGEVEVMGLKP